MCPRGHPRTLSMEASIVQAPRIDLPRATRVASLHAEMGPPLTSALTTNWSAKAVTPESATLPSERSLLRRARIYLDAASPRAALELLTPVVDRAFPALPSAGSRLRVLSTYLESCHALRLVDRLNEWQAPLRELMARPAEVRDVERVYGATVLARLLMDGGAHPDAILLCEQTARGVAQPARRATRRALVRLKLRETEGLMRLGRLEEAEACAVEALRSSERLNDPRLVAQTSGWLSYVLRMRGRLEPALQLILRAERLHAQAEDSCGLVQDLIDRAWVLNRLGRIRQSRRAFDRAAIRAEGLQNPQLSLRAALGRGLHAARDGHARQARELLLRSWRTARTAGLGREACLALLFLSEAHAIGRRMPAAWRALRLAEQRVDSIAPGGDLRVTAALTRALLLARDADWESAAESARLASELASARSMGWEAVQAMQLELLTLARVDRPTEARAARNKLRQTLTLFGVSPRRDFIRRWRSSLATGRPAAGTTTARTQTPRGSAEISPTWSEVGFLTRTRKVARALADAAVLARHGTTTLILGETGVGKELLARGMHRLSGRAGPFVPFNCGGCPADLVESELFGAARGAFTGADRDRPGLLSSAHEGTLLLDEVEALPARAQRVLLRFLDSGEVRAVGARRFSQVDTQVLAAAQPSILHAVSAGSFRADLYYRLAEARVDIPSLRDRRFDLPLLLAHYWRRIAGSELPSIFHSGEVKEALSRHSWPGNVRELRGYLRSAQLLLEGNTTGMSKRRTVDRLISLLHQHPSGPRSGRATAEWAIRAVHGAGGNHARAARELGISRQALYRLLRKGRGGPEPTVTQSS